MTETAETPSGPGDAQAPPVAPIEPAGEQAPQPLAPQLPLQVPFFNQSAAYISFTANIDDNSCRQLLNHVVQMMNEGRSPIYLMMSTLGGYISSGFALYNSLRALPTQLISFNMGNIDSIGNVVFLAADERHASPNTTFMFHGAGWEFQGAVIRRQVQETLSSLVSDEERIMAVYRERTGLTAQQIDEFFSTTKSVLEAGEALAAGIVQSVAPLTVPPGARIAVVT